MRSNKIHAGLQLLVAPITVKLNNLSAMEINTIRPFFQRSLDRFYSLSQVTVAIAMLHLHALVMRGAHDSLVHCFADGRQPTEHAVNRYNTVAEPESVGMAAT